MVDFYPRMSGNKRHYSTGFNDTCGEFDQSLSPFFQPSKKQRFNVTKECLNSAPRSYVGRTSAQSDNNNRKQVVPSPSVKRSRQSLPDWNKSQSKRSRINREAAPIVQNSNSSPVFSNALVPYKPQASTVPSFSVNERVFPKLLLDNNQSYLRLEDKTTPNESLSMVRFEQQKFAWHPDTFSAKNDLGEPKSNRCEITILDEDDDVEMET